MGGVAFAADQTLRSAWRCTRAFAAIGFALLLATAQHGDAQGKDVRSAPRAAKPAKPSKDAGPPSNESPLSEVRERVRAGDWNSLPPLLDALPADYKDRPQVRYLRARMYEKKERINDALDSLPEDLSKLPSIVARDIQVRRALWLARTGRCGEARPMLTALAKNDTPDSELTLRAADCALSQSDPASALVLLRDTRSKRFAVRLNLAKILVTTGDEAGALRELEALWIAFPDHSRLGDVESQLRLLVPNWQPGNDEFFGRADHYLDLAQPEAALAELEQIALPKPKNKKDRQAQQGDQARLAHFKGMALFKLRSRYADAAKVLAQAAALGGSTQSSDAFHSAQALARADKDADAVRAYGAFVKRFPKDPLAVDARHAAAWLELRHGMPNGEAHMQALLKTAERQGAKGAIAEALWELAIYSYTHKHCDRGMPLFERYAGTGQTAMIKARGLYWAGRCALQLNKRDLALSHFRNALAVEPLHWYALLARGQIAALGEDPGPPFPKAGDAPQVARAETPSVLRLPPAAAFYEQLGLTDDAINALRRQETQLREGRDDDGLASLAAAYHALGEFNRPYMLAERERDDVLLQPPHVGVRGIWDALFPKPYAREVTRAAESASLPTDLVYAVIRKESAYNPTVVSSADAIGLMQLIERTAKSNAQDLKIANFERAMLYEPGTNVLIGSHYLSKLISRYRGQAVPAIAAYNAGEHRVDPWLKRAARPDKTLDLDWFVEDIPIDQTRNYVKRVVCSWARYRYLEDPSGWPLELPLTLKL